MLLLLYVPFLLVGNKTYIYKHNTQHTTHNTHTHSNTHSTLSPFPPFSPSPLFPFLSFSLPPFSPLRKNPYRSKKYLHRCQLEQLARYVCVCGWVCVGGVKFKQMNNISNQTTPIFFILLVFSTLQELSKNIFYYYYS